MPNYAVILIQFSCLLIVQVIRERRPRTKRWVSSSIPERQWSSELALYSSADYHVNNLVSPVLFQEALLHVPDNAIVIEIAPHSLLQAVLRRALASTCTVVGLMDKRQTDNLVHLLTMLGKYVCVDFYCIGRMLLKPAMGICMNCSLAEARCLPNKI